MLSLWGALEVPTDLTLVSYALPPIICYFAAAALAVTQKPRSTQVALWLVTSLLTLRAIASADMSLGRPWQKLVNVSLVYYMYCIVIRSLDWAVAKEPLMRHLRPANSTPSIFMDVLDLITNYRGHGWNWSRGLYVPQENRPTDRVPFAFSAFLSAVEHAFVYSVYHRAILSFAGVGPTTEGFTIFDDTLPFFVRYLRAAIISIFAAFTGYASMQMGYDIYTVFGVLLFRQDPAQWPPVFNAPWFATSLNDFWGRRWHQWNRRSLILLGGYPFSIFFGRTGLVLGTFLASGIMHDIILLSIDRNTEAWRMLVGFGMMAPGLLAERTFYRLTGKKVDGVIGWVWTMAWLVLWGSVVTEGCARAGGFGNASFLDVVAPLRDSVDRLVIDFDSWLHAL